MVEKVQNSVYVVIECPLEVTAVYLVNGLIEHDAIVFNFFQLLQFVSGFEKFFVSGIRRSLTKLEKNTLCHRV